MSQTELAVAADYADAMLIARRWKNLLFLFLLLLLLIQIGVFLGVRFSGGTSPAAVTAAASRPATVAGHDFGDRVQWLINFTGFLAVLDVLVLAVILLLILGIMLIGRLVGVANLTGAFVLCVVLGAILFPWQSVWNYPVAGTIQSTPAPQENIQVGPRFGLPGVLYTWPELRQKAYFANSPPSEAILGWARFVGWPVVAVLLLFSVQVRSSRGLKLALGETHARAPFPTAGAPRVGT